jgi:peptide/nickel transport system substrate-binding protein
MISGGSGETIDPRLAFNNTDQARCFSLYDTLLSSVAGGHYAPALAEEVSSNHNATLWTFKVRQGVTFHNGKPLTADDVVWSIKASWGSTKNTVRLGLEPFIDFAGARKLDKYTVQVPLRRGLAEFPTIVSQYPLSIVPEGTTDFNKAVGTGPFMLESFTPGTRSTFKANKNYWQSGTPYVDELDINSSFTDNDAQLNALLAGDLDVAPGVPQALAKANAASKQLVLGNVIAPGFLAPTMHITKPPFTDVRVRQALRLLAQREEAVARALDGYGTPGNDVAGQTLKYYASGLHRAQDVEQAKFLLKKAGQENLTLELFTADIVGGQNEIAILYANQASAGGVKVNVRVLNPATYYTPASPGGAYPTKAFSMNNWQSGMPCLSYVYLTADLPGAPYNEQGWGGTANNQALYSAMAETDPTRAAAKWQHVQELQFNEGGYIIMANFNNLDAYSPSVRGVQSTSAGPCNNYNFSRGWLAS